MHAAACSTLLEDESSSSLLTLHNRPFRLHASRSSHIALLLGTVDGVYQARKEEDSQ